jgi:hypothetical protein
MGTVGSNPTLSAKWGKGSRTSCSFLCGEKPTDLTTKDVGKATKYWVIVGRDVKERTLKNTTRKSCFF